MPTDRLIEDGSYIRLSNITAGYTLDLPRSKFFNELRMYAAGNNLLTITDYSGFDPEITSYLYDGTIVGVDWLGTQNVRTIMLGLNLKF